MKPCVCVIMKCITTIARQLSWEYRDQLSPEYMPASEKKWPVLLWRRKKYRSKGERFITIVIGILARAANAFSTIPTRTKQLNIALYAAVNPLITFKMMINQKEKDTVTAVISVFVLNAATNRCTAMVIPATGKHARNAMLS